MNYRLSTETLFEDFENAADWTVTGSGGPTITADTSNVKTGTQSLKFTTGVGTNCTGTKTISLDASKSGVWGYWAYIQDVTMLASIQINIANDSAVTNRYVRTVNASQFHNGWNFMTFDRSLTSSDNNLAPSGTPSWASTMIRLRFVVNANASSVAVVSFDSLYYGISTRPKIVLMFDDGWTAAYTEGFSYLRKYGIRATVPVNSEKVGDANHATLDQLREMYNAGWDMINHTTDHTSLATLSTETDMLGKVTPVQNYLVAAGMTRNNGYKHFIYPSGSYNDTTLQAMLDAKCTTAGTIISHVSPNCVGIDNTYQYPRRPLGGSSLTAATAMGYLDIAVNNGGTYFLFLHKLVSGTEADTNEWQISKWQPFVDYLAKLRAGNVLDTPTFTEWYEGLTYSRRQV